MNTILAAYHAYALWPLSYRISDWRYLWSTCRHLHGMQTSLPTRHNELIVLWESWLISWLSVESGNLSSFQRRLSVPILFVLSKNVRYDKGCIVGCADLHSVETTRSYVAFDCLVNRAEAWNYWPSQNEKMVRRPASLAWGRSPLLWPQNALHTFLLRSIMARFTKTHTKQPIKSFLLIHTK